MKRLIQFLKGISIDCYMVCLYFVCLPFTVVTTAFGSLLKVVTMPVVAVLGIRLFLGKTKPLAFNSVQLVYSLYIIYVIFGLFISRTEYAVTNTQDMLMTYAVMMLITMRTYTENEQQMIESTWVLVGIVCAYLALTSSEVVNEFENRTVVSVFGFPEDPNQFCAYFVMPAMICIKRIVERRKAMILYAVLVVLMFYSILRTGSRGGMLGIVIGIVMCMLLAVRSIKAKIVMVVVGSVCAFIILFVAFPLLPEDVQMRYNISSVVEDNAAGRFDIWKYLINYTFEKPSRLIYGSGLLSTYTTLEGSTIQTNSGAAHNQFIQVLTDQGVIGFTLFLLIIACCFLRNVKKQPYYACAFAAIMVFSMSLTMYLFKPYINIIMMCAMTFICGEELKGEEYEIPVEVEAEA